MRLEDELERVRHWEYVERLEEIKRRRAELDASLITCADDEAEGIRAEITRLDEFVPVAEAANNAVYERYAKLVEMENDLELEGEKILEELRLMFDDARSRDPELADKAARDLLGDRADE